MGTLFQSTFAGVSWVSSYFFLYAELNGQSFGDGATLAGVLVGVGMLACLTGFMAATVLTGIVHVFKENELEREASARALNQWIVPAARYVSPFGALRLLWRLIAR